MYSSYLKKKKKDIKTLLNILLEKYEFVSILGTDVTGYVITCDFYSKNMLPSRDAESGFCIKVYKDSNYYEYCVNDINSKNIQSIVESIDKLVKFNKTNNIKLPVMSEQKLVKNFVRTKLGKDFTKDEIMNILEKEVNNAKSFDKVLNVTAIDSLDIISKCYYSKDKELTQVYPFNVLRCNVVVRENDNVKMSYNSFNSTNEEENLSKLDELIKKTYDEAVMLLSAKPPVPGVYDVITDPSITGLIAHEAFGHGVEMDMFVKERAKSVEYIGKEVASPLITMHDGAAAWLSAGSYFFDDDGVLAQDTVIIDNGTLVSGISDFTSSLELGTEPTGNSRRETYKHKSYARMTNTFFESGTSSLEDMIKSIDHGYYLFKTNNGMEDPKSWGIQCTAHYGIEILNGKLTNNVISPVVMSGYVVDLLKSISAVSTDFHIDGAGGCGKGYKEWVRVSDGGACLKARVKIG